MRSLPLIFLGVFATLAFSWTGLILMGHIQLGQLEPSTPQYVDAEGNPISGVFYSDPVSGELLMGTNQDDAGVYPRAFSGAALRGKRVYEQMGCLYCHSQQVRRPGFGSDFERGWGERQSVARDYIHHGRVMLGTMRTGPDLANVGLRYSILWQHQHLYNPLITTPDSIMPRFAFLYDVQPISETLGPSPNAIPIPEAFHPGPGLEVIPTQRANDLVAYLMILRQDYDLPEEKRQE